MNNTKRKLTLRQETVRILAQEPPLITTMPYCPTGFDTPMAN
jgi:hypothetical protein